MQTHRRTPSFALCLALLVLAGCAGEPTQESREVPISTASEEARELYLQARDLSEKLRVTDGHELVLRAVEKDPQFAMAHLLAANTSLTAEEFFPALERAVELADTVSEAEQRTILAVDAGVKSNPDLQQAHLAWLVQEYAADPRVHNQKGNFHFGRQEWEQAIAHYREATALDPAYSQPYNQLGYALRFTEDYRGAEQAFQEYIRLIPDEPNPYDSYAELLMKLGRFDESIENYERALEANANFTASYIGIANNHMFAGRGDQAREALGRLSEVTRNPGEKRQALFGTVISYVHEGDHAAALEAAGQLYAVAEELDDFATMSGDTILMGNILLHAGRAEEAQAKFAESIMLSDRSDSPDEVKRAVRRNSLYNECRAALARGEIDEATVIANRYGQMVAEHQIPFELWQHREVVGRLAMENGNHAEAIEHFDNANQQDPRVLYATALACRDAGDLDRARELAEKAANWNALGINFAYVRTQAQELLSQL